MKLKLVLLGVLLLSPLSFAAEKADCGLAIDEADKIVPDPNSDCDHTKTGLNGVLHRAFASKSSSKNSNDDSGAGNQSESRQSENPQPLLTKASDEKREISKDQKKLLISDEFSNAQELQLLKFNLLAKAAVNCAKGFSVDAERYLPTVNKNLKLELVYQCL